MWQLYMFYMSFNYNFFFLESLIYMSFTCKFICLLFVFNIHSKLIISLVGSCPSLINLM